MTIHFSYYSAKDTFLKAMRCRADFIIFEDFPYYGMRYIEQERERNGGKYAYRLHYRQNVHQLTVTKVTWKRWCLTNKLRSALAIKLYDMDVPTGEIV
jgi:hypothetical protein